MTQRLSPPIEQTRLQLNAALSDPEGWTVDRKARELLHTSGFRLSILTYPDAYNLYYTRIFVPHTTESMQWTTSETGSRIFVPSITTQDIPVFQFIKEVILNTFPTAIPPNMDDLQATLLVFQKILRLNWTPEGAAMRLRTHQELAAQILLYDPEALGRWYIDIMLNEAERATEKSGTFPFPMPTWSPDALVSVGLPIRMDDDCQGFEVSPYFTVDVPSSAHARAALLHAVATTSVPPNSTPSFTPS